MLAEFAQSLAPKGPLDINAQGKQAWTWGYTNLFLCEYYGATGDTSVLPSIKEYATKIAMGQSAFGTWAHRMAIPNDPANNGKLNGRLGVYGAAALEGLIHGNQSALFELCYFPRAGTEVRGGQ